MGNFGAQMVTGSSVETSNTIICEGEGVRCFRSLVLKESCSPFGEPLNKKDPLEAGVIRQAVQYGSLFQIHRP